MLLTARRRSCKWGIKTRFLLMCSSATSLCCDAPVYGYLTYSTYIVATHLYVFLFHLVPRTTDWFFFSFAVNWIGWVEVDWKITTNGRCTGELSFSDQ